LNKKRLFYLNNRKGVTANAVTPFLLASISDNPVFFHVIIQQSSQSTGRNF